MHQEMVDHSQQERERESKERLKNRENWQEAELRARIHPILVATATTENRGSAPYSLVETRVRQVRDHLLPRDQEIALAQGFKLAANRRARARDNARAREFLSEQAWEMLKYARFWYSRLTLLHALTLWALPDDTERPQDLHGKGSDPQELVRQWLRPADDRIDIPEHPFVDAARRLSICALQTRKPEKFLWIDEAGTAAQVGSENAGLKDRRRECLWIAPSAGWSTLEPTAQQLLADVLILLILAERGDRMDDRMRRFERTEVDRPPLLPPCLTRSRRPLDPMRTEVRSADSPPGSNCSDRCSFELCPFPPKGPESRIEFSETFCMTQRAMLRAWRPRSWVSLRFRRKARWQRHVPVADLRQFWSEMEGRAWDRPVEEVRP